MKTVYLHSPMHDDTDKFCRAIFSSHAIQTLTRDNVIVWAGKVWDPEAYGLCTQLEASTFPFLAMLVPQNGESKVRVFSAYSIIMPFLMVIFQYLPQHDRLK